MFKTPTTKREREANDGVLEELRERQRLKIEEHTSNVSQLTDQTSAYFQSLYNVLAAIRHNNLTLARNVTTSIAENGEILFQLQDEIQKSGEDLDTVLRNYTKRLQDIKNQITNNAAVQVEQNIFEVYWGAVNELSKMRTRLLHLKKALNDAQVDMKKADPLLTKSKQTFSLKDIDAVSNYTKFERVDQELQKAPLNSLLNSWRSLEAEIVSILKQYPECRRITYDGNIPKLVHIAPTESNFSTMTQNDYDALDSLKRLSLEREIGNVLNQFYLTNSRAISQCSSDILKSYTYPFGMTELPGNKVVNVYAQSLNRHADINLAFLARGGDTEAPIGVIETPRYIIQAGNGRDHLLKVCPKASYSLPPPLENDIEMDEDEMSESEDDATNFAGEANMFSEKIKKANSFLKARWSDLKSLPTLIKKASGPDDAPVDVQSTTNLRRLLNYYNTYVNDITDLIKFLQTMDKKSLFASFINLSQILTKFDSLAALQGRARNKNTVITYEELSKIVDMYNTMVETNTSVSASNKIIGNLHFEKCMRALDFFRSPQQVKMHELMLPLELRHTSNLDLRASFELLSSQLDTVVRSVFNSDSLFHNPRSGFSMGKLNKDASNFLVNGDEHVISFLTNPTTESGLNRLKEEIDTDRLGQIVKRLEDAIQLQDASLIIIQKAVDDAMNLTDTDPQSATSIWQSFSDRQRKELLKMLVMRADCGVETARWFAKGIWNRPLITQFLQSFPKKAQTVEKDTVPSDFLYWIRQKVQAAGTDQAAQDRAFMDILSKQEIFCLLQFYGRNKVRGELFQIFSRIIQERRATPFTDYVLDANTMKVSEKMSEKLKSTSETLKVQLARLLALEIDDFEKSFSTKIGPIDAEIVRLFESQGYEAVLKQDHPVTLYMMGPSGSGKSYTQYGTATTPGIDRVLFGMAPEFEFYDLYFSSFGFKESVESALKSPSIMRYTIDENKNFVQTEDSQNKKRAVVNLRDVSDYKRKIDDLRRGFFIRPTVNNIESSRSFFIAKTKYNGYDKTLVDAPGFEKLSAFYVNPFIHLYSFVRRTVARAFNTSPPGPQEADFMSKSYAEWLSTAKSLLSMAFEDVCKQMRVSPMKCSLDVVDNELVPLPVKFATAYSSDEQRFSSTGIMPRNLTFKEFIDSTFLFFGSQVYFNKTNNTENLANISQTLNMYITNLDSYSEIFISDLDIDSTTQNKAKVAGDHALPPEYFKPAKNLFHIFGKYVQNLFLFKSSAMCVYWTWKIYKRIFLEDPTTHSHFERMEIFLNLVAPEDLAYRNNIRTACEAYFYNQFNLWSQNATLIKGNSTLMSLADEKYEVRVEDVFYEFMLFCSDFTVFSESAVSYNEPRFRFAVQRQPNASEMYCNVTRLGFINTVFLNLSLDAIVGKKFFKPSRGDITFYNTFNDVYKPLSPSINLNQFDDFITQNGKNLFITIFNGEKADRYFSFMDLKSSAVEKLKKPKEALIFNASAIPPDAQTRRLMFANKNMSAESVGKYEANANQLVNEYLSNLPTDNNSNSFDGTQPFTANQAKNSFLGNVGTTLKRITTAARDTLSN